MNSYLAELYDTNGYAEKVAQVEENVAIFMKVAEEEGYDLSELSEDEIVELANELAEDDGEDYDYDYDEGYVEGPDNLGPKTAEADFLGRVMAHSFHQEQEKIAKSMGSSISGAVDKAIGGIKRFGGAIDRGVRSVGRKLHTSKGYTEVGTSGAKAQKMKRLKQLREQGMSPKQIQRHLKRNKGRGQTALGSEMMSAGSKAQTRSERIRGYTGLGAGAALAGGGAYAATRGSEKKSHIEAIDEMAIERANEFIELADRGYDVTFDKVANAADNDIDQIVNELAWNVLVDEGWVG